MVKWEKKNQYEVAGYFLGWSKDLETESHKSIQVLLRVCITQLKISGLIYTKEFRIIQDSPRFFSLIILYVFQSNLFISLALSIHNYVPSQIS